MANAAVLADFAGLLHAAQQQAEPQRLLFVFAHRHLDGDPTRAQRASFERGAGGYLEPCLCVDKLPDEVSGFAGLVEESEQLGMSWDVVFVASLAGRNGVVPTPEQGEESLRYMVNAIHQGLVAQFAAFDRAGDALKFA